MDGIASGAAMLSTYGLYFIVAVLGFVSYKLFCKTTALEKEFREYIQRETKEAKEAHERLLADSTKALKDSTEAINKVAMIIEELRIGEKK